MYDQLEKLLDNFIAFFSKQKNENEEIKNEDKVEETTTEETVEVAQEEMAAQVDVVDAPAEDAVEGGPKVFAEDDIKFSSKEIGGKVELVSTDGALVQAEDGDYKVDVMPDVFTVKDGFIVAINGEVPPTPPSEVEQQKHEEVEVEAPAEEPKEDVKTIEIKFSEDFASKLMERFNTQVQPKLDEINARIDAAATKVELEEIKNDTTEKFRKVLKLPAQNSKTNTSLVIKETNKQDFNAVASLFGK